MALVAAIVSEGAVKLATLCGDCDAAIGAARETNGAAARPPHMRRRRGPRRTRNRPMPASSLLSDLVPWTDRRGRFSALRAVTFAAALLPAVLVADALVDGRFDAEPFKQATHLTGTWTLYFLLASLAVTPLKRLLAWPRLAGIAGRRNQALRRGKPPQRGWRPRRRGRH